jgi:FKBP-type peptidyl-prolyl cis-trans isomerase FkpA
MRSVMSVVVVLAAALPLVGCPQGGAGGGGTAARKPLATDEEKSFYALGLNLARNIQVFNVKPEELEFVIMGLRDAATGAKPEVELNQWGMKLNEMARTRQNAKSEGEKAKGKAFLETASKEAGVTVLASGTLYKELTAGTGEKPAATDTVKVHYKGTLVDGTEFDSSYKRNQPTEFPLNGVIKCWTEGVGNMKVGAKARLTCPSDIAYGDSGRPPTIPGGAVLVFEVELLEITKKGG